MLAVYNYKKLSFSDEIDKSLQKDHEETDDLMLKILFVHWVVAASVMGLSHGFYLFGAIAGAVIFSIAYVSKLLFRGSVINRMVVAACFMLFSMTFIQQNLGQIEMHFHVFVSLAILARYKDYMPQVSALATILVHHLVINYCQAQNIELLGAPLTLFNYGTGLTIILIHALFATAESIALGIIIYQLTKQYCTNLDVTFQNQEVLSTLNNLIVNKDFSSKISESNEHAELVSQLLELFKQNAISNQALASVTSSVVVADTHFKIVYVNQTAQDMFERAESDIHQVMPGFNASNVLGLSIDEFHASIAQQHNVLEDLDTSYRTNIDIGERNFQIIFNPIMTDDGSRIGTVMEWSDRTSELNVENDVQSLVDSALSGDISQRISLEGKDGFIERLSGGINNLLDVLERVVNDTVRVFSAMSRGDLTETIETEYQGAFNQLKNDANQTINKLTEIVGQIKDASDLVETGAKEISQGNLNLSQRTEMQASRLEETSASIEEMTGTVRQNANNAKQANELVTGTRDQAEKGGEVVESAVSAMHEINEASTKISNIIGVIDEIAFQTNLLALNAAVEAARAGEQGRGFAVVASEVRNLAGRSATAAKEIKELIEDSVQKVEEGSRLVNQSGDTLEEIMGSVKRVADIVGDISVASQEQATGIEQVNKAIVEMDESTQQNAALVEEASAAAESMSEQSNELTQLVSFFNTDDDSEEVSRVERRSSERPWTNGASTQTPVQTPVNKVAGDNYDDADWEEF